jgi:hypothetical protein
MLRWSLIAITVATLAVIGAPVQSARKTTPPGSFIRQRANTVSELASVVERDPLARARYAKHFGRSADTVVNFIKNQLRLTTVKARTKTYCWYVGKNGQIRRKVKVLPAGALVFATKDGKPIIAWSCGNPLTSALPDTIEAKVLPNPPEVVTAALESTPELLVEEAVAQEVAALPTIETLAGLPLSPLLPSNSSSFGWIGALGGLVGGLAVGGDSDGGNDTIVFVPEPSGVATLVVGAGAVMGCRFRRRPPRRQAQ